MILTYRYRIKETNSAKALAGMARAVNVIWNYCGGAQEHARRWNMRWPSGFDLINLTSGVSRDLGHHSDTVQAV
jgi:putative transposase